LTQTATETEDSDACVVCQLRIDPFPHPSIHQVFPTFELCIHESPALPAGGAEAVVLTEDYERDEVRAGVEAPRSSQ